MRRMIRRATEHHGHIDLVLVFVDLDHVHQAVGPSGDLRERTARRERREQTHDEPAQPALNA